MTKRSEVKKFIITGGGTGGHVFPALAIAKALSDRSHEVLYLGTQRGMESTLVPKSGFPFYSVRAGAVKNQGPLTLVKTVWNLALGFLWSSFFILRKRPDAVIGVGGYVSVPVVAAAVVNFVPVFLQEQNVSVGLANRLLGKFAKKVFLGFEQAESYFPKGSSLLTGNPIRQEFFSDKFSAYQSTPPQLLIMGGSQGARAINEAVCAKLPELSRKFPDLRIVHQTGKADYEKVKAAYASCPLQSQVSAFIEEVAEEYAKASLVLCRAGALTVSELIATSRPAIFVPYPRRGQNDQVDNAKWMESQGVARCIPQGENFEDRLTAALFEMLTPEHLLQARNCYSALRKTDATATIASYIENALRRG